jgi:hypothetical protein
LLGTEKHLPSHHYKIKNQSMTKQQTIDTLKIQLPGFYSAEQVIELISKIEDSGSAPFDMGVFKDEIENAIRKAIENMDSDDVVDYDSADLSLDGREIALDSIDVNTEDIISNAVEGVYNVLENFFPPDEDEDEDCGC